MPAFKSISWTMKTCSNGSLSSMTNRKNGSMTTVYEPFSFVKEPSRPSRNLDGLQILFIAADG